jgi:nitrate reductase gamma subunit
VNTDFAFFVIFPYLAFVIAFILCLKRYFSNNFKYSSLSSQLLEGRKLFWGSVPWHIGIIIILFGHLLGFLFPKELLAFGSVPARLFIIEVSGLICGFLALLGLVLLIKRRITSDRVRAVTSPMDMFILLLLLVQVGTGVAIATQYRWGATWYAASIVPYLRSLLVLSPEIGFIAPMPFMVKLHIVNAALFILMIPFSRLIHFLVPPIPYIWRAWQRVIWNWDRKMIRKPRNKNH